MPGLGNHRSHVFEMTPRVNSEKLFIAGLGSVEVPQHVREPRRHEAVIDRCQSAGTFGVIRPGVVPKARAVRDYGGTQSGYPVLWLRRRRV